MGKKLDSGKLAMHTVLFEQFPLALREVVKCSMYGHNKYKEEDKDWQNFSRIEDAQRRYADAMLRHEFTSKELDEESGLLHGAHTAWNALAKLEIYLRKKSNNG